MNEVGNWNVSLLKGMLSSEVVSRIVAIQALAIELGPNVMIWKVSKDGEFSIRSVYNYLSKHGGGEGNNIWKKSVELERIEKNKTIYLEML